MCAATPLYCTQIWIWTYSVKTVYSCQTNGLLTLYSYPWSCWLAGDISMFLCLVRLASVINAVQCNKKEESFYPELFCFIPLQKWSSCPFDWSMSDGPAFNELIQSTFSWLLPLTTFSAAKHLSWTGWQAFWLKSFNISPVLAILGWCCWQFGKYICIRCQLERWYKWMMISASDGDTAGWSRSSLLSLLNHHYTVYVCASECVNAMQYIM